MRMRRRVVAATLTGLLALAGTACETTEDGGEDPLLEDTAGEDTLTD